ncbi:MAG: zinc-binding alcohol dehydrogenase [Deltaproteobacteria bacterium]|nr:zinc-binding alcohol dehydrogenase [Deltaproteobacteria bacterium]
MEFLCFEIANLEDFEFLGPKQGEVLIETFCSLVSPGTERAILCGLPGMRHHFPHTPGYSAAGVVANVGKGVKVLKIGDRVAGMIHHASHETVLPERLFKVPDGVSYEEASFLMLGFVALQGIRKARIVPGDRVVIIGQGLIGQISSRLARLCGASKIIAVAATRNREKTALLAGADEFLSLSEEQHWLRDVRADVVIEAAGTPQAVAIACNCARENGRLSLIGSSRGLGREVDVWELMQKKKLTVVGAHSSTVPEKDASRSRWTYRQEGSLFLELLQTGRLTVSDLITWRARPDDCNRVYEVLGDGGHEHVGIIFNWREDKGRPVSGGKNKPCSAMV